MSDEHSDIPIKILCLLEYWTSFKFSNIVLFLSMYFLAYGWVTSIFVLFICFSKSRLFDKNARCHTRYAIILLAFTSKIKKAVLNIMFMQSYTILIYLFFCYTCFQQRFHFHNWELFADWLFRLNRHFWLMLSRMIFFWILKIIIFHKLFQDNNDIFQIRYFLFNF